MLYIIIQYNYILYFQICDFRYAKRMDGSQSYTICGDPLYFAPEMVKFNTITYMSFYDIYV